MVPASPVLPGFTQILRVLVIQIPAQLHAEGTAHSTQMRLNLLLTSPRCCSKPA